MATLVTLNPIVRVARVPLHYRENFRLPTKAARARHRRRLSGLPRNRTGGRNETGVRSFHDALQWRMCNGLQRIPLLAVRNALGYTPAHPATAKVLWFFSFISVSVAAPTLQMAQVHRAPSDATTDDCMSSAEVKTSWSCSVSRCSVMSPAS
jgi:hypothetical protein